MSILSGLESAKQALTAQQYALSITQRNVANANNEAYTRQDAIFSDVTGYGVPVSIEAARNQYLDYSIGQELQSLGKQDAEFSALQQVDALFNEKSQGLQSALSNFFNSYSALSANPEDITLRQQVLSKANALTSEFHRLFSGLQRVQTSVDNSIGSAADDINSLTGQIAEFNKRIGATSSEEAKFSLRDQRQQLVENLSGLIDISYYESETGALTISTKSGGLLVIGTDHFELETAPLSSAGLGVMLSGSEITDDIQSGKISGLIDVRGKIAGYISKLDDMAATMAACVNEQQAYGMDLHGHVAGDASFAEEMFSYSTAAAGSNSGAAQTIQVAISDPTLIAAADPTEGVGSNKNAVILSSIKDEKLFSSSAETISQYYSGLIYHIGSDEKEASDGKTIQTNILDLLKNQRSETSGVNMDEEAIKLIQYQKAYQASSRYASVLISMSDEVLKLI
jgi:flagellar hook-associated protein 1 FlgK